MDVVVFIHHFQVLVREPVKIGQTGSANRADVAFFFVQSLYLPRERPPAQAVKDFETDCLQTQQRRSSEMR